jgi:hypothetical protein
VASWVRMRMRSRWSVGKCGWGAKLGQIWCVLLSSNILSREILPLFFVHIGGLVGSRIRNVSDVGELRSVGRSALRSRHCAIARHRRRLKKDVRSAL